MSLTQIQKRGQITIFIIIGILILFSIGLIIALNKHTKPTSTYTGHSDTDAVQLFFEKSLQGVTDDCLYDIGLHGGYINPDVAAFYGDPMGPTLANYTKYYNENVPIYITDIDTYKYPNITEIEERLENIFLSSSKNQLT